MTKVARTGIIPVLFFVALSAFGGGRGPSPLSAQGIVRAWLPWRTIETRYFVFHYPLDLEEWTRSLASRADAIQGSVESLVGYAPPRKTQVVVDDPYETSNGSAWPFLDRPVINLWASPPDPRNDIGEFRNWGRTLLSHEFTHVAHLARPSRNARLRALWRLGPVDLGPITVNAPRWVIEGFATFAEGRVTGSGRPHGSWRPAYLRQWALEGQLPRYEQLNAFGSFDGGEFAYLAGSAFLEWLAERHGDSSLVDVWRRMTAKTPRGFDEAFTGVYGESPRALYGRFTADLTGKALVIDGRLREIAPGDTGQIVQRLSWATGDPAVSHDGRRVAIALSSPTAPARIVVWGTAAEPDTLSAKRDSSLLKRDPEDVPPRRIYPPPKRALATLRANTGAPYESPRFLPDGRILVSRLMRVGDGSLRSDLLIWNPATGAVRRVTRGASLRTADPSPDGRTALAMRCDHGWCDVALVDLATGRDTVLLRGSPERSFFRPRFSPDGSRLIVSMNENGRWRLVVASAREDDFHEVPRAGNVYDAAWVGGDVVVATSDEDGIPNLEMIDVATGRARRLTQVSGAAVGAEAVTRDSSIWFLSLYSRGYDLRRVHAPVAGDSSLVGVDTRLAPASMTPPTTVPPFATNPVSAARPFDLRARLFRWLPLPQADADGYSAVLAVSTNDVIGRSEIVAKGAVGDRSAWRGGSLDVTWRGFHPVLKGEFFSASQSLSDSRSSVGGAPALDTRMTGGLGVIDRAYAFESWSVRARLAGSGATLRVASPGADRRATSRTLVIEDLSVAGLQRSGMRGLSESLSATSTIGRSFDTRFSRVVAAAAVNAFGFLAFPVSVAGTYGITTRDAPAFERLSLGGNSPALFDRLLTTQRVAMGALPSDVAVGTSALTYRIALNTQPLAPYFWSGSTTAAGSRFDAWHRVLGLEGSQSIAAIAYAGVPSARVVYGVGESLDAPFRRQIRGYLSVVINP
jgi:Tol biopolymer transport system component